MTFATRNNKHKCDTTMMFVHSSWLKDVCRVHVYGHFFCAGAMASLGMHTSVLTDANLVSKLD